MIGDNVNTLFANLPDATQVEAEPQYVAQNSQPDISTAFLNAFRGTGTAEQTSDFAAALGDTAETTQTADLSAFGATESFALPPQENAEKSPNNTASQFLESQSVFDLAERANRKDQEDLLALQLQLQQHTSELAALVEEAKAQNPQAVREEEKFLREETASIGIYYVAVAQRLAISVKRAIKSMITLLTSSANYGASWKQTKDIQSRQRDELKFTAQAAG